jgi:hypothetical protein
VFDEPPDVDFVLWIQGAAAVPYLEVGTMAELEAWRRVMQLTRGDVMMFAVWFN